MFVFALALTPVPSAGGGNIDLISFWYSLDDVPDSNIVLGEFGTE